VERVALVALQVQRQVQRGNQTVLQLPRSSRTTQLTKAFSAIQADSTCSPKKPGKFYKHSWSDCSALIETP
jgi:hypothetical protein